MAGRLHLAALERLESMAQDYLGSHAPQAENPRFLRDGFRPVDLRAQALEARLEAETGVGRDNARAIVTGTLRPAIVN